ncbi:hypothetical protein E2651_31220 [Streptomyces sp. MZ04]|nr:hypothetical protein E2651_31220 [Streptomyces sp. MZ04]
MQVGRLSEAIAAFGRSLEACRQSEDWRHVGDTLHHLAVAHAADDRPALARTTWLQAAEAYDRAGAPAEAAAARDDAGQ